MADPSSLVRRHVTPLVFDALDDTRVVTILGARQTGKSTLAREVARNRGMTVISLDASATRQRALADPDGFIADLPFGVVIDEIQRVPDLLLAIKLAVDTDPRPGRFLLTGSANLFGIRRVIDALPGRMEIVTLMPFSQAERESSAAGNLVDALFDGEVPRGESVAITGRNAFAARACAGGFPDVVSRLPRRRAAWFASYLEAVLGRDVGDVMTPQHANEIPRLMRALAARTGSTVSWDGIGKDLRLSGKTITAYTQLLETLYLVTRLPAWRPGMASREVAAPKVHIVDSGLLAYLLNANERRVIDDDQTAGAVFEALCANEILRHLAWSQTSASAYHYRDLDRKIEIDLLLERSDGKLLAIEMKAAASIAPADVRGLRRLVDERGDQVAAGVLLYTGATRLSLGDRLWAVPVSGLWSQGAM